MALLHSSWQHITLPWLYFTLLDSTFLYHISTSHYFTLHYSTVDLLHFTWLSGDLGLHINLPWIYFTLRDWVANWDYTLIYHGSTSIYLTSHFSTMALLDTTWLYRGSTSLYVTIHDMNYHGSTSLYFTLHFSTMPLHDSTFHYHDSTHSTLL